MKNTSITLRTGDTVTIERRTHGVVFILNGAEYGPVMFLRELVETCAESGGSVAALLAQLGIEDDGACWMCDSGRPRTLCPVCGIVARCESCASEHDGSSICRLTLEAAHWSRVARGGDTLEPIDHAHAVRAMYASYVRRSVQ